MKIFKRAFERDYDNIAVIYELGDTKTVVAPKGVGYYTLDPHKDYLIVCGQSEYLVHLGIIEESYKSKDFIRKKPLNRNIYRN